MEFTVTMDTADPEATAVVVVAVVVTKSFVGR